MTMSHTYKISRRNTDSFLILKLARAMFTVFYYSDLWGRRLTKLSILHHLKSLLFPKTYLVPGRYGDGNDRDFDAQIVTPPESFFLSSS